MSVRCMVVDDDAVSSAVLQRYILQHGDLALVASCSSAIEAERVLRSTPVDLLYLDVEMPEMTGLELVRALTVRPEIVLVTGKESYAAEAYSLEVADYLVKPIEYSAFLRATARVQKRLESTQPAKRASGFIFVRSGGRLTRLDLTEVLRVEAKGDAVLVHTPKKAYQVTATMKAVEASLPDSDFVRVHRSHIVRIDQIVDIEETNLVVGREVIPISASYRPALLRQLRTL
jgi:DNA-binding LytR/AlgR family response regulator